MSFDLRETLSEGLMDGMNSPGIRPARSRPSGTLGLVLAMLCLVLVQCGGSESGPASISLTHNAGGPPASLSDLPLVTVQNNKSMIDFTVRVPRSGVSNPRYELALGPSGGPPSLTVHDYELIPNSEVTD